MRVKLPYGRSYLTTELPDENVIRVINARDRKGLENPNDAIEKSLKEPIGSDPLKDLVSSGDKVAIITTDNTRACPDDVLLPHILRELRVGGVWKDDITIVIGTGLHRKLTKDEMAEVVGKEVIESYRVMCHDPDGDCVYLGETSRGIPIEVNRRVYEADFIISTGFIEPHFFAGFSGGRKLILPAVSSRRAIYEHHSFEMIDHPKVRTGVLEGNPFHEDMLEHAEAAGLNFIVNVVLNRFKEIVGVFSGDFKKAHEEGVKCDRELVEIEVEEEADITIASNSGYPLDRDFYQAVKGMDTASTITKEGGTVIVVSECIDGVGPKSFYEIHRGAKSPDEVYERIKRNQPIESQWQNQVLARLQKKNEIIAVTSLEDTLVRDFLVIPAKSVDDALEIAFEKHGKDARIIVVTEGPFVMPVLKKR
jgi:nickel-dependent lactate racemase